jgi:hypothetical protein
MAAAPRTWRVTHAGTAVAVAIGLLCTGETLLFANTVDATRAVLDTQYDAALADRASRHLPAPLHFLRWTESEIPPESFAALVEFLRGADGEFALVSDLTPLKGMRLSELYLEGAQVADVTPLTGMPLTTLTPCS